MYNETGLHIVKSNPRYSVCRCPLPGHNDAHASSVIYHDTHTFVCFRCHVRMPLEKLLQEVGLGVWSFERPEIFAPQLYDEDVKYQPLTSEAMLYLERRGVEDLELLPQWIVSPVDNRGISFLFQNKGSVFGYQTRLFPYFLNNDNMRYVLTGKRLPWFGDLQRGKQEGLQIICFEKAFGTLKAYMAAQKYGLPIMPICSAGSHFQRQLLDLVGINTIFAFDNDVAGREAGKRVKHFGFRVVIPKNPIDEQSIENVQEVLEKCMQRGISH